MRVSTGGAASAAVSTKQASEHGSGHPLDNPVLASLTGPHARFAQRRGGAVRYPADVSPFLAIPDEPTEQDWADIAVLAASGAVVAVTGTAILLPASWQAVATGEGVQMTGNDVTPAPDEEAVRLTRGDVPDMLALVKRTRPGPFLPRTIELGAYLGIRRDGKLVAMAGERLHPPGWTEISAVCTDPAYRGQGLASRLVRAVAHGIQHRNETPFLHAAASNTNAIRLYVSLGFRLRRTMVFQTAQVPGTTSA
jgi:ribosomal protein S18 acetylase RimI-like enzyme